jgi:hypothetical protein
MRAFSASAWRSLMPRLGVTRGAVMVRRVKVPDGERAMPHARGPSTGPRTPEGLERSRRSNWKHGYYSAEAKRVRRDARQHYRLLRQLITARNEDEVLDLISSM